MKNCFLASALLLFGVVANATEFTISYADVKAVIDTRGAL